MKPYSISSAREMGLMLTRMSHVGQTLRSQSAPAPAFVRYASNYVQTIAPRRTSLSAKADLASCPSTCLLHGPIEKISRIVSVGFAPSTRAPGDVPNTQRATLQWLFKYPGPDCLKDTKLLFLFLLIAPVLTSITPISASNAHR